MEPMVSFVTPEQRKLAVAFVGAIKDAVRGWLTWCKYLGNAHDIRIRVFIIKEQTYPIYCQECNITRILKKLNQCQDQFIFYLLKDTLSIRRNYPVKNALVPTEDGGKVSPAHKDQVTRYIADLDAFGQVDLFIKAHLPTGIREFTDSDLVLLIGSQIYIPETEEEEIHGVPELDSYSCLGNLVSLKDEDNNNPKSYHNIGLISLSRAPTLFPDIWNAPPRTRVLSFLESDKLKARTKIARYTILNIAHFLIARVFGHSLAREHMARCVAETNWNSLGGEVNSYSARGICGECSGEARDYGPAIAYTRFNTEKLLAAINKISLMGEYFENLVAEKQVYKIAIGFSLVIIAISVFGNLLAGLTLNYEKTDLGLAEYISVHIPALSLVVFFILIGGGFVIRNLIINRVLP